MSITLGIKSAHDNFSQGAYLAGAVDSVGVVIDGVLAAVPLVPGVAGLGIQAARSADEVVEAVALSKQLASEGQMADLASGRGIPTHGAGTDKPLAAAERLAAEYGGKATDYQKVSSNAYTAADGSHVETHAFRNVETGEVIEPKSIIFPSVGPGR